MNYTTWKHEFPHHYSRLWTQILELHSSKLFSCAQVQLEVHRYLLPWNIKYRRFTVWIQKWLKNLKLLDVKNPYQQNKIKSTWMCPIRKYFVKLCVKCTSGQYLRNIKHFPCWYTAYINASGNWKNEKLCGTRNWNGLFLNDKIASIFAFALIS